MWLLLIFSSFIALIAIVFSIHLLVPMLLGAPFVRTRKGGRKAMFELARIKTGELVVDLGSGDGQLLIEAAQKGAKCIGYEINPWLVYVSRSRVKKLGLQDKIKIIKKSLWRADVSQADVILLFGIVHIMPRLEKKLQAELRSGARVVSFTFSFPHWVAKNSRENVKLYLK